MNKNIKLSEFRGLKMLQDFITLTGWKLDWIINDSLKYKICDVGEPASSEVISLSQIDLAVCSR